MDGLNLQCERKRDDKCFLATGKKEFPFAKIKSLRTEEGEEGRGKPNQDLRCDLFLFLSNLFS